MEINTAYEKLQEALLRNDAPNSFLKSLIKRFDRKATQWIQCLERANFLATVTPGRGLGIVPIHTQLNLIDGLVRYAQTCSRGPMLRARVLPQYECSFPLLSFKMEMTIL